MPRKSNRKRNKQTPKHTLIPAEGRRIVGEGSKSGEVLYLVEWIPSYETKDMIENFGELIGCWRERRAKMQEKKVPGWRTYWGVTELDANGKILNEDEEKEEAEELEEEEEGEGIEEVRARSSLANATVDRPKKDSETSGHRVLEASNLGSKGTAPGNSNGSHRKNERRGQSYREIAKAWSPTPLPKGVTPEMRCMLTALFEDVTKRDMSDLLSTPNNDDYYEYATKSSKNRARKLGLGDLPILALARLLSKRDDTEIDSTKYKDIWIRFTPELDAYSPEQEPIRGKAVPLLQVLDWIIRMESGIRMRNVFTSEYARRQQADVCRETIRNLPQLLNTGHFRALLWIRLFLSKQEILGLLQELQIDTRSDWLGMAMEKLFRQYQEEHPDHKFEVCSIYTHLRKHIRRGGRLATFESSHGDEEQDSSADVEEDEAIQEDEEVTEFEEGNDEDRDASGGEDGDYAEASDEGSTKDDSSQWITRGKHHGGGVLRDQAWRENRSIAKKHRMSDSEEDGTEEEAPQMRARKRGRAME